MRALAVFVALAGFAVSATPPAASFRLPASSFRLPASSFRLPVSSFRPPASSFRPGPIPLPPAPSPRAAGASPIPLPPAPSPRAAGAIRGRVDVRVAPSADVRPDPAGLGMGNPRDAQDRRRSVVYLETAPRAAFETPEPRRARMNQRGERFIPHVLAITAGTWVDFPNSDRTYHNVFSLSKTKSFNLGRYAAGHSEAVQFDQPGVVRVFCEIHSHMSAFILVFAHRFFAMTDDEGRYRIDNVPPGTYTLVVWNEATRGEAPRKTVTVGDSGEVDADFTIR